MKKEIFKKEYLKDLPESSGVYFFLQKNKNKKEILYIGKATNLKDRVSSYFSNDIIKTRGVKILSMIENANNIEFIVTRNVLEAIMLESKLIKEHQPNFNTKEKDNKSYSCVVITKEDFPRVLVKRMREIENVKDLDFEIDETFGPFTSKDQLLKSLKIIRKIFPYRDKCKVSHMDYQQPLLSKRGVNTIAENKPCFNFQIGLCPGTCCNKISKLAYVKNIKHIKNILNGETEKLLKDLQKEMKSFAKVKDFENAGSVRDKIYSIEHIKDIALITEEKKSSEDNLSKLDTISVYKNSEKSTSFETEIKVFDKNNITVESYDVAHISGSYRVGVMCKFEIEKISENNFELNYKKDEYKKFKLLEKVNDDILGLKELLERRFKHKEWIYPDLVLIDGGKTHLSFANKILENILSKEEFENIKILSIVKDDRHKAREILFDKNDKNVSQFVDNKDKHNFLILANEEAHRFAISYHKVLRNKIKK